jgi:hypothetical protein
LEARVAHHERNGATGRHGEATGVAGEIPSLILFHIFVMVVINYQKGRD